MKKLFAKYPVGSVLLMMLLCLAPLMAMRDFTPANELRYLSIADEAIANGDVFAFTNHGEPYADKPPLYFWIIMLCKLLLGRHSMFALSLFSLIPAFVIIRTMDRWAFPEGGDPVRRAAAAMMLGTTGLFLGMSVFLRMDMLMCMWIVLALYAFSKGKRGSFALFTFLALFTKGPVGVLVPPLAVIAYLLATKRGREIGKWFGWRFWAIMAGGCAIWFGGVAIDGGKSYLENLLVHQTVGRAVNSFHHKAPFWYYACNIWYVMAPWCLAAVPAVVISFCRKKDRSRTETLWIWTAAVTFVMLSLFSSKLAIYLAPAFAFIVYVWVLLEGRTGWKKWMKYAFAVPGAIFILLGVAMIVAVAAFGRIGALAEYGFARSPLVVIGGVLLLSGGVVALRELRKGWTGCVLALGTALLLMVFTVSWKMPQINALTGYAQLCEDIKACEKEHGDKVYMLRVYRPENVDVYLGHQVTVLDKDADLPEDGIVVTPRKMKPALQEKMAASGRKGTSKGEFILWTTQQ